MQKEIKTIDIDKLRIEVLKILEPIKQSDENTSAKRDFLFSAERSEAGAKLPQYYLVYFLFADLLKFKNLGKFEKIAWSFPIDYKGKAFLVEYRKFGLGIFIQDIKADEIAAREITGLINRAVTKAKPFYDLLAENAVKSSKLNITNRSAELYSRYEYLVKLYNEQAAELIKAKGTFDPKASVVSKILFDSIHSTESHSFQQQKNWLAISAIEAFFSWTEHIFIHIAIINGNLKTGEEVAQLSGGYWKDKYSKAIKLGEPKADKFYSELLLIRQQLRNFVAHGAFGKEGNAFSFHSETGAVPVLLTHKSDNRYSLTGRLSFDDDKVIKLIEDFVQYLKTGPCAPAFYYLMDSGLPTILTYANDGTYARYAEDLELMTEFTYPLMEMFDNSANMDW